MLEILYVMDPMDRIQVHLDTTFAFQLESQARGHAIYHCRAVDLSARDGQVHARCRPLRVVPVQGQHFELEAEVMRPLGSFDCVMMRKDPPFDMEYVYATYLLEAAPRSTFVLNRPDSLRSANEKLYAMRFPGLLPETLVTTSAAEVRSFIEDVGGQVVVKPLDGAGGESVFYITAADRNLTVILETITRHGTRHIMAQRYLPEIVTHGDKRIILLDGEPLGGTARMPPAGELRGNIHVGGVCVAAELTERDREICAAIGPTLRADGLWFVGIDVIGDFLTEVNVTSPTGVHEINRLQGLKIESDVIDFVERRCAGLRSPR
jgi:glutathione synthase